MKFIVLKKRRIFQTITILVIALLSPLLMNMYRNHLYNSKTVMGGAYYQQFNENKLNKKNNENIDFEEYFRPSKLPILNDRDYKLFSVDYVEQPSEVVIPDSLLSTPEDTLINYFSILREAANPQRGKITGCGSIGYGEIPYPIAYNFLSSSYQDKVNYKQFLKSFENILHIDLIKLRQAPRDEKHPNSIRNFIEMETIEGSEKGTAHFAYYYGFIYLEKEENQYKITGMEFHGENYLCAPYHGWDYIAEAVVDIKYGDWCSLVKERYQTQQDGYIKKISFKGTDGNDYLIEFYLLTNGTDIEVTQYKKNKSGEWESIYIDTTNKKKN